MTFDEALKYKEEHKDIAGYQSELKRVPYFINYLFIAPKNRLFKDRMDLLEKNLYNPIDNETALKEMGFYDDNLDVYVIWKVDDRYHEMLLHDYLNELNPK